MRIREWLRLFLGHAQANAEAVARVRVARPLEPKADRTASVAGDVKVIAAATYGTRILFHNIDIFMAAGGVEVIEHYLPYAATHVRQSEAIAAPLAVLIYR